MRRRYSFILTSSTTYACKHCGDYQRISRWDSLALLACKIHERKCTPTTQKVER